MNNWEESWENYYIRELPNYLDNGDYWENSYSIYQEQIAKQEYERYLDEQTEKYYQTELFNSFIWFNLKTKIYPWISQNNLNLLTQFLKQEEEERQRKLDLIEL